MKPSKHSKSVIQVVILKATRSTPKPPKEKYIKTIIMSTFAKEAIADIIPVLIKRLEKNSWHAVLKTLTVIHRCFKEGSPDFMEYLKTESVQIFNLKQFLTSPLSQGHIYSIFVKRYSKYLEEQMRCFCNLGFQFDRKIDCCKNLNLKDSLIYIPKFQCQFNALLNCKMRASYTAKHPLVIAAHMLLLRDSLNLYLILNEGIIGMMNRCFEMGKQDAKQVLDIYTLFIQETDCLVSFYESASDFAKNLPRIQRPRTKFIESLQDYINELDSEPDAFELPPHDMAHQISQYPIKPNYEPGTLMLKSDNNNRDLKFLFDAKETNNENQTFEYNTSKCPSNDQKFLIDVKETNTRIQPFESNTSKCPPNIIRRYDDNTNEFLGYSNNHIGPNPNTIRLDSVSMQIPTEPDTIREANRNLVDTVDNWKSLHPSQYIQNEQNRIQNLPLDITLPFDVYRSDTSQPFPYENPLQISMSVPTKPRDHLYGDTSDTAWKNQSGTAICQEYSFFQPLELDPFEPGYYYPAQSKPSTVKLTPFEDLISPESQKHVHSSSSSAFTNTAKDTKGTPGHMATLINSMGAAIDRPEPQNCPHNMFSSSPIEEMLYPNPFCQIPSVGDHGVFYDSKNPTQRLVYLSKTNTNTDKPNDYYSSSYNPFLQR